MSESKSKVWLITGSSRGLGRAFAEAVLAAGHQLVATARKPEQLGDLKEQYGDRVSLVAVDVTRETDIRAAVRTAVDVYGRLDILVNNAGYGNTAPIEDVDEDDFRAQWETNFFGVFHGSRAAIPVMRAQGGGHIIQIASIGGRMGSPGMGAYQSAKWAVEGFSEVLSREVAPFGIKVTIIEPGGFRTDWAGSSMTIAPMRDEYQSTIGTMIQLFRSNPQLIYGDPAKAAQALLQVAGEEQPPLRLLLGSDAVFFAELIAKQRMEGDAAWREVSLSTDADGMPPVAETYGPLMARLAEATERVTP